VEEEEKAEDSSLSLSNVCIRAVGPAGAWMGRDSELLALLRFFKKITATGRGHAGGTRREERETRERERGRGVRGEGERGGERERQAAER
jgi:hypothetical protein